MEPLVVSEASEEIKDNRRVWRPWHLKQLELLQGVAVSFPSYQRFTQEYLLISWHVGTLPFHQYRHTRLNGSIVDGKLLMIEPGETWRCQGKDVTFHSLSIDPVWLQQFAAEMLHREQGLPHFSSHPLFNLSLNQTMCNLATKSQEPASRLQQEEALLYLLAPLLLFHAEDAEALPQSGWEHPAIKRTQEYLQAHYAEEVALQELASVVNLSPFHLSRAFHQAVGLPPHAYQTQIRLAHAKALLAQGFDVSYVAMETGFYDQSHLTLKFKRRYLVTPGSYRTTARFS